MTDVRRIPFPSRRVGRIGRREVAREDDLTRREFEVLRLMTAGSGTDAIARSLAISRVTVRNHAQRILKKLDAHSRLEAVATARRLGLLREPEIGYLTDKD